MTLLATNKIKIVLKMHFGNVCRRHNIVTLKLKGLKDCIVLFVEIYE